MEKCEVCGSPVRIVGGTTKHYEPIQSIRIGDITISEFQDGDIASGYWLAKDDGEGMQVKYERLEKLIADFFRENM